MQDQDVAHRLKAARIHATLTQQEVAKELNVTRTAVTQIEAGRRRVSDIELDQLSKLYRRSTSWLKRGNEERDDPVKEELCLLVENDTITSEHLDDLLKATKMFGEAANLKRMIGINKQDAHPPIYTLSPPSSKSDAITQGEYYAEMERKRLGMGHAPIGNMMDFLLDQDIWFSMVDMKEDVSGIFINDKEFGMAVITNSIKKKWTKDSGNRDYLDRAWLHYVAQRLSVAHQYAHILFDSSPSFIDMTFNSEDLHPRIGKRQEIFISQKSERMRKTARRANAFAGAFLLPKHGVDEELKKIGKGLATRTHHMSIEFTTGQTFRAESRRTTHSQEIGLHDVMFIANRFGVSFNLAVIRLASLAYIDQQQANDLLNDDKPFRSHAHGYSKLLRNSEGDQLPSMPDLAKSRLRNTIANFTIEAHRAEKITVNQVREYAAMIEQDAEELIKIAKLVARTQYSRNRKGTKN